MQQQDKVVPSSRPFVATILRFSWAKDLLCSVPDDYIQDRFNLCELPTLKLNYGKLALSLVCGHYTLGGEKLCPDTCIHDVGFALFDDNDFRSHVWKLAVKTYFFIHQRWLQTPDGQKAAQDKYINRHYGICPLRGCLSRGLLPGVEPDIDSVMNNSLVKFCPHCNVHYDCVNLYPGIGDAFGPNFIANFLMAYPLWALPGTQLKNTMFGFRIHPSAFDRCHWT